MFRFCIIIYCLLTTSLHAQTGQLTVPEMEQLVLKALAEKNIRLVRPEDDPVPESVPPNYHGGYYLLYQVGVPEIPFYQFFAHIYSYDPEWSMYMQYDVNQYTGDVWGIIGCEHLTTPALEKARLKIHQRFWKNDSATYETETKMRPNECFGGGDNPDVHIPLQDYQFQR